MKNLKISHFLSWVCSHYLEGEKSQAVFMKFRFGKEEILREVNFIGLKDPYLGLIYGWSKVREFSLEPCEIYNCCEAPLGSIQAENYIDNLLLETRKDADFFIAPDSLYVSNSLKYSIVDLRDKGLRIEIA